MIDVRNDLGIEYDMLREGAGGLNGKGALELARTVDTEAQPGMPWLTTTPFPWTTIAGESYSWNQTVILRSTTGMTAANTAWKKPDAGNINGLTFGATVVLVTLCLCGSWR
jgi:hypothetical protein